MNAEVMLAPVFVSNMCGEVSALGFGSHEVVIIGGRKVEVTVNFSASETQIEH